MVNDGSANELSHTPRRKTSRKPRAGKRHVHGYSWPIAEPGNTLALTHGATSPRAIATRAELVHAELLEHAPYLAQPKFLPAVSRYLQAAVREALLHEHITTTAAERGIGAVPSRVWEQATAAARLAFMLGSSLGLDPIGHARIRALSAGAEHAEGLAELAAEGRRIRTAVSDRQTVLEALEEPDDQDGAE